MARTSSSPIITSWSSSIGVMEATTQIESQVGSCITSLMSWDQTGNIFRFLFFLILLSLTSDIYFSRLIILLIILSLDWYLAFSYFTHPLFHLLSSMYPYIYFPLFFYIFHLSIHTWWRSFVFQHCLLVVLHTSQCLWLSGPKVCVSSVSRVCSHLLLQSPSFTLSVFPKS